MEKYDVIIIGSGPAGLEAAYRLAEQNVRVAVLEKDSSVGGKLNKWEFLFPNFAKSADILNDLNARIKNKNVDVFTNVEVCDVVFADSNKWKVLSVDGKEYLADAVLVATGFDVFDAKRKEEYGYGIYPSVITSAELEEMLAKNNLPIKNIGDGTPKNIAFIQCVGSRDEKMHNHFCSKNCCICAVKQAIEVKEKLHDANVFCFYMDLRMYGQHYEELYRRSQQEFGVTYIRGRVSEISPTFDGRVILKAEDTLISRPVKMTFDLVVLMVGMEASKGTKTISTKLDIRDEYGYFVSKDEHLADNLTNKQGVFVAGTCKRQLTIPETMKDADVAAMEIINYLKK